MTILPYKDPEKKRQYQREYNKKRRGSLTKNTVSHETRIETAEDLRLLLEDIVSAVRNSRDELELEAWARVLIKAVEVGIKVIEVTDLERRVTALEGSTDGDENKNSSETTRGEVTA